LDNNKDFKTSFEEAIHNIEVCKAIRDSSNLNKQIIIDENK
jgi:hypothetical protein